jgi:hypothetical protein
VNLNSRVPPRGEDEAAQEYRLELAVATAAAFNSPYGLSAPAALQIASPWEPVQSRAATPW